jgi:glycosyltransferase involved in cell wall biosynthesis
MKISFVVLTYNRTDALLAVLRSLAAQCDEGHEVLVADDGSRPEQVQMLFDQCPAFRCPARHVWHPDVGFTAARARNLGASQATGDYLVFLDGDCVPNKAFVAQQTRLAEKGCFLNGSRVLISQRLTERVVNGAIDLPEPSCMVLAGRAPQGGQQQIIAPPPLAAAFIQGKTRLSLAWHTQLQLWRLALDFAGVNGFDETFQGWGHEDADLVLRLHHLGLHRKNGFMGTEVFHLWHRENPRDQESINKKRVLERMKTDVVLAEKGLRELEPSSAVKITSLNGSKSPL